MKKTVGVSDGFLLAVVVEGGACDEMQVGGGYVEVGETDWSILTEKVAAWSTSCTETDAWDRVDEGGSRTARVGRG